MSKQFEISSRIYRNGAPRLYRRKPGEPTTRALQVFATDPADSALDGALTTVKIPWEPLRPGPEGKLFNIVGWDEESKTRYSPLNLDDPLVLAQGGIKPSTTNYQFLMQMSYAVAMTTYNVFRRALGRDIYWAFEGPLQIYPFARKEMNAYYNRERQALIFGWYRAEESNRRNLKNGLVFTALSHDIIAHEVSHALLDGMRPYFFRPYHHDTLAFHEAFSDLVAIFQHFRHRDLVSNAIMRCRGNIKEAEMLTDLARQFGHTTKSDGGALRTSVDDYRADGNGEPKKYKAGEGEHALGSVLVSAVFEAFTTIFERKTRRLVRLATNGSGVLREGAMPELLAQMLARKASELADQFLSVCIRAIDYCPPVAVSFGDFLRAVITADYALVPDDPYGYREALVDAFVRREIPIQGVTTLSEESLLWPSLYEKVDNRLVEALSHEVDEYVYSGLRKTNRRYVDRANIIGKYLLSSNSVFSMLALDRPGSPGVGLPKIESARVCRRISPDGYLEIDLVIEIAQNVKRKVNGRWMNLVQGSTVILDTGGRLRHVISKTADQLVREMEEGTAKREFPFEKYFGRTQNGWDEKSNILRRIHESNS